MRPVCSVESCQEKAFKKPHGSEDWFCFDHLMDQEEAEKIEERITSDDVGSISALDLFGESKK